MLANLPKKTRAHKVVRDMLIQDFAKNSQLPAQNIADIVGVSLNTVKAILNPKIGKEHAVEQTRRRFAEKFAVDQLIINFMDNREKILTTSHLQ